MRISVLRAFTLLSLHLWKRCLKQASTLARNFYNLPGTSPTLQTRAASLKIWLRKHKSQLQAKWTLCEPFWESGLSSVCRWCVFCGKRLSQTHPHKVQAGWKKAETACQCPKAWESLGLLRKCCHWLLTIFKSNHPCMEGRAWNFSYKHTK